MAKKRKSKHEDVPEISATIRKGVLLLRLPLEKEPKRSSTGKTEVVASTRGFRPVGVQLFGAEVYVTANACIYADSQNEGPKPKERALPNVPTI